ncbi:nitroreductase family protein [Motiliproteus sp. MSK22-1]|uniref:nitroreductase family protein n=1 Tax=Motiliproteus sp. MSK22-1 TaxID=1897630 RepID=UPI000975DCBA|nr:nitroreductase family protein [Motiliproteus sp. MSK22-1]OMH25580.1 nitroreductase [Motiliproteus sp. MSK22-1]
MSAQLSTPLSDYQEYPPEEMARRAEHFYQQIKRRHSIRDFSGRAVERRIIESCIRSAATAPSGANHQPWHFVAISDPAVKKEIREKAEYEEQQFYGGRAGEEWLDALKPLGTNEQKPFLETAPWLIAIFAQTVGTVDSTPVESTIERELKTRKNYYVRESVGIATGFLIDALHHAGLVTLTHTPKPMLFLNDICQRDKSERPYILMVVGYPAEGATIPIHATKKKPLEDISTFI